MRDLHRKKQPEDFWRRGGDFHRGSFRGGV
jgi:hypothetical protein